MKAIVIDDEEGARESLCRLIERHCPAIQVIAVGSSADEGYKEIASRHPDLVFLDIEMPFGNAFDLLARFDTIPFEVIFVTAYDHYAIRAIRYSAADYLLKPVDPDELAAAVGRISDGKNKHLAAEQLKTVLHNLSARDSSRKIALPDNDGITFVNAGDIIRCESESNYTRFHLSGKKTLMASRTLGEFEDLLSGDSFIRIHRSHLINLNHVKKYVRGEGGYVIMDDHSEVEVSRRKKQEFLDRLSR